MKKVSAVILSLLLVMSLAACAKTMDGEKARVKCPACGYEFDVPAERP